MDDEKLREATSLKEKIEKLKSSLERCEKLREKSVDNEDGCALKVYGESKVIDHDIFEIALFAQEKRLEIQLSETETEYSKL